MTAVEDDCDQGFSLISDGCSGCRTTEVVNRHGHRVRKPVALEKVYNSSAKQYGWRCPNCGGWYGLIPNEDART